MFFFLKKKIDISLICVGDGAQDRYFFCNKGGDNTGRGRLINGYGFWKATASKKRIICSKKMPIIGIRKSFVFHQRTKHCVGSEWIMHEYYLALSENNQQTHDSQVINIFSTSINFSIIFCSNDNNLM